MVTRNVAVLDSDIPDYSTETSPAFSSGRAATRTRESALGSGPASLLRPLHGSAEFDHHAHEDYRIALLPHNSNSLPPGGMFELPATGDAILILPFTWRELLDRVRRETNPAISGGQNTSARFGDIRVDFLRMQVSRSQNPVALTHQEFKLLRFFIDNPHRVLSRDELLNEVWGYNHYPSTRTVDNHVWMLRRKLEDKPACPVHFLTVQRIGYKFVPHKAE